MGFNSGFKGLMWDTVSTKESLGAILLFIVTGWSYEDLRLLFDLSPNILAQLHQKVPCYRPI